MFSIIDLFFKQESLTGQRGSWITPEEREKLKPHPLRFTKDMLRQRGIEYVDELMAAGSYDANPLLKRAILTFKYKHIRSIAEDLGMLLAHAVPDAFFDVYQPAISAVPLHWTRRFSRGFNQSEMLAEHVAWLHKSSVSTLLRRNRPTGHQAHRDRGNRLTALVDAFRYIGPHPAPQHVVLIDDLSTTGATLEACAKELKKHGVKRVCGLVVAQG